MATKGTGRSQNSGKMYSFEPLDKLASNTLKRHPKMELNKTDLVKLLSVLEAELQAREIVIAVLKAEQVKQLLYPKRKQKKAFAGADPLSALQRDVFGAFDPNFDEGAIKAAYNVQLHQLELLIAHQRKAQAKLREQLRDANEQYSKAVAELDDERRKHAQDTAQGDDVTYLLEKERERLHQEVDFERQQNKRLEKEAQRLSDTLEEERLKQKQIVLLLLAERKRLVLRLLEERQQYSELSHVLHDEKSRMADMVEGLEEESKKSLQMEAEMERQLSEFDYERESYKVQVATYDLRNQELMNEVENLQGELEITRQQLLSILEQKPSPPVVSIGEGVRSTIVTMVATQPTLLRAVPTITSAASVPRNLAKPVSSKGNTPATNLPGTGSAPATPAKPPGLIAHAPTKIAIATAIGKPVPLAQPSSAVPITLSTPQVSTTITVTKSAKTTLKATSPALPPRAVSPCFTPLPLSSTEPASGPAGVETDGQSAEENSTTPGVTPSVSATVKLFANQATVKVSPTSGSGQSRKPLAAIGRGTPPPVPPNKPILAPTSLLRKDLGPKPPVPPRGDPASDNSSQRSPRPLSSIIKMTDATGKAPEVSPESSSWSLAAATQKNTTSMPTSTSNLPVSMTIQTEGSQDQATLEIFGQELADFQQLFVSMANGQWPEVM